MATWTAASAYATVIEPVAVVAASGAAQTIVAPTVASITRMTLTAACTLTFPPAVAGESFTLYLTQDATGSRLVTWPAGTQWAAGTAPTLTTTAAALDVLTFICADGAAWQGFVAGLNVR